MKKLWNWRAAERSQSISFSLFLLDFKEEEFERERRKDCIRNDEGRKKSCSKGRLTCKEGKEQSRPIVDGSL
jgi:hypothetical protein